MADPTLEDDLETLRYALVAGRVDDKAADAFGRVKFALKDREHLEEAARILFADGTDTFHGANEERAQRVDATTAWLERERDRKQGNSGVAKESK